MRLFAILALLASSVVGVITAVPSAADPLCETVTTSGTDMTHHTYGTCEPYGNATICRYQELAADPEAHLDIVACVPAPVIEP
jgi:hypothetical protein